MRTLLQNAMLLDCRDETMRPSQASLMIDAGHIAAIEPGIVEPGPDTATIDLAGAYLLPGLWDVHCHPGGLIPDPQRVGCFETEAERTLRAVRNTGAALRAGITALRAVGETNYIDVALRETYAQRQPQGLWRSGYADKPLRGPRMFCAGPALRMTGGHGANGRIAARYLDDAVEVDGPDDVRKAARECIKLGVDWIKLCITGGIAGVRESMYEIQMSYEEIKAACDVAHAKGLKVCAHTGSAEAAKIAVQAGIDSIEHGYQLDDEACAMMAEGGVAYCPTLSVTQDEAYMRRWEWPEYSIQRALDGAALHREAFQRALRAGVTIVNGADLNPIADTAIPEIEWVVAAGMAPAAALLASTRNAAALCGALDSLGTIEVGKLADLIVVRANPLEQIAALRSVELVMQVGHIVVNTVSSQLAPA